MASNRHLGRILAPRLFTSMTFAAIVEIPMLTLLRSQSVMFAVTQKPLTTPTLLSALPKELPNSPKI